MFYFGVKYRDKATLKRARSVWRKFNRGIQKGGSKFHVDTVYLSLMLKILEDHKRADPEAFYNTTRKLLDTYPKSTQEYETILLSLCKVKDNVKLLEVLEYSINTAKMPRSLKKRALCSVAMKNATLAWGFFKEHYDHYFAMYGESQFSMDKLLECAVSNLKTQEQLNDIEAFFKEHSAGTGTSGLERAKDLIRNKIENSEEKETEKLVEKLDNADDFNIFYEQLVKDKPNFEKENNGKF